MTPSAFIRGVAFTVLLLASTSTLHAQGVGAIFGTATDASGGVLPGVTVTLSSAQGTVGGSQETTTDDRGTYQFLRLVPGVYSVRATVEGFRPFTQENIVVNSDVTARADIRLTIGQLEEGIVVTGDSPLLDTTTVLRQTVLNREELEALPNRTDVWSIARVIPGVVMSKIDVGGTEAFLQSAAAVRGTSSENKFTIDGMDVSALDGTGTVAAMYLDPFAFEETNFQTGAGSAEQSNGGLTFNMITRTGTNQLHGGAKFNGTTPALSRSRNYSPELRAQLLAGVPARALAAKPDIEPHADIRHMTDGGAWLAGPIVRDKLWFSGTWHDQRLDRYNLGSYDPDGTQVLDDNWMWTTTAKIAWQMTRTAQLSYFNNLQYKLIGHRGGGVFADSRARQYNDKYPDVHQVKFTSPFRSNKVVDISYSRFRADDVFGSRPEVMPGDVATMDTTTQVTAIALPTYNANAMFRDLLRGSVSYFTGAHDFKAGYEFVVNQRKSKVWSTSGLRANFANGVPTSVNTYLLPVTHEHTYYGSDIDELFVLRENTHGIYVQDKFTPFRKLVLNLGLRYETSDSWQPATCRPDTVFYPGACYDEITAPSFRDFSPRLNAVYDLNGDGRTALKFAANRYSQPINISVISRLNPVATVMDQRPWTRCSPGQTVGCDVNNDLIPQLNELGPSPGYVFAGVNSRYAEDLARPVSNEYTVEVQRQLPQNIVLSVGYSYRQTRRNIGQVNTAAPASSWIGPLTVTEVTSGRTVNVWNRGTTASANLFYNSEEEDTNYHGSDITVNKRMSHRWSLQGGASFGRVTSRTRGGNRSDPNITSAFDSDVIGANDRPWSYRMSGVYEFPHQIFASGTWQYQAGPPETTVVLVTNQTINLAQGNQEVRVAPVGEVLFPNVATLDLNIRKTWRIGRQTLSPRLEIFNATNESTISAWVSQLGPTYHRPSGLQRGRLIKLELGYEF
jgi:hypothetical protein